MQAIKQQFKKDHVLTIGVEFGSKFYQVDGKNYRVQIWDTVKLFYFPKRQIKIKFKN